MVVGRFILRNTYDVEMAGEAAIVAYHGTVWNALEAKLATKLHANAQYTCAGVEGGGPEGGRARRGHLPPRKCLETRNHGATFFISQIRRHSSSRLGFDLLLKINFNFVRKQYLKYECVPRYSHTTLQ